MILTEELAKTNIHSIIIVQVDITAGLEWSMTDLAFVYRCNFFNSYPGIPSEWIAGVAVTEILAIGSVRVNDSFLHAVASEADVALNRESFYFNSGTKDLYIQCPNGDDPAIFQVTVGKIFGYRKGGLTSTYNGLHYKDLVLSIPKVSRKKADYFSGRNVFEGGAIELNNAYGDFDTWAEDDTILGNPIRLYCGIEGMSFDEFLIRSVGYVKDIDVADGKLVIAMQDKREKLDQPVLSSSFDVTTYPYLDANDIGKSVPVRFGPCRNVPVTCTNQAQYDYSATSRPGVPVTLGFRICDMMGYSAISAVSAVRVDDGDGHLTDITAHCSISLTAGTFTTTSTYYVPGQKVTVDLVGYVNTAGVITNALDIILELLCYLTGARPNSNYFNFARWDRAQAFSIGISIDEQKKLIEVIEEITQKGTFASFGIDDNDLYSCRITNEAGVVKKTYDHSNILNKPVLKYQAAKLVSELTVKYNHDYGRDQWSSLVDDSYAAANSEKYQTRNRKAVETLLATAASASLFAYKFLLIFGRPYKTIAVETNYQSMMIELSDIVYVALHRPHNAEMGILKCEVIGTDKDFDILKILLELRVFKIVLPSTWMEGNEWYAFDWYTQDWIVGENVRDLTA